MSDGFIQSIPQEPGSGSRWHWGDLSEGGEVPGEEAEIILGRSKSKKKDSTVAGRDASNLIIIVVKLREIQAQIWIIFQPEICIYSWSPETSQCLPMWVLLVPKAKLFIPATYTREIHYCELKRTLVIKGTPST